MNLPYHQFLKLITQILQELMKETFTMKNLEDDFEERNYEKTKKKISKFNLSKTYDTNIKI